jgi:hypothetical protein
MTNDTTNIPDKPSLDGIEARWMQRWEADATYRFDRDASREGVFAIDTPPPTVSGSLHIGHVFSYTHTDTIARYQRMQGKAVFYPIGWDDNGLATERRVQNVTGVRCDPSLPYDPSFTAPFRGDVPKDHRAIPISRPNFVGGLRRAHPAPRPVGRLVAALHHHRRASAAHQPTSVPAQPRPRRGVPAGCTHAVRHRRTHGCRAGRDGRSRHARRVSQGRVPPHHHLATARRR